MHCPDTQALWPAWVGAGGGRNLGGPLVPLPGLLLGGKHEAGWASQPRELSLDREGHQQIAPAILFPS